ncbi:MAG: hypothetical protein ABIP64_07880 [Burkholderiales bacterium]
MTVLVGSKRAGVRRALRARIVLLAAQGSQNKDMAVQMAGIERDLPGGASPLKIDVTRLIELTPERKAEPAAHWSTRVLSR